MVYKESDDTFLMNDALIDYNYTKGLKGKLVLELGCGNCYNAIFCAKQGAKVVASDIDKSAIEYCKNKVKVKNEFLNLNIDFYVGDMFSSLNEYKNKFDLIFFNPPYLISNNIRFKDLDGLKKGRHWIDKFIEAFNIYLNKNGSALLLHTDYNDLNETRKKLNKKGFSFKIIKEKHLFFEKLYVLHITQYTSDHTSKYLTNSH